MIAVGLVGGLAACQSSRSHDEAEKIDGELFKVLTANGKRICVDGRTHGEPLAIFRTMLVAPDPVRRPLMWSAPAPLEDGRVLTGRELVDTELGNGRVVLPEHGQAASRLPVTAQLQLNALARAGSYKTGDPDSALDADPAAPLAVVRWWVRNRFDSSCGPIYTLSRPAIVADVAFVTVTAGHNGSTYAFQRTAQGWKPVAKWSTWLY